LSAPAICRVGALDRRLDGDLGALERPRLGERLDPRPCRLLRRALHVARDDLEAARDEVVDLRDHREVIDWGERCGERLSLGLAERHAETAKGVVDPDQVRDERRAAVGRDEQRARLVVRVDEVRDRGLCGGVEHHARRVVVERRELGVDERLDGVLAQQARAEAVDRRDDRALEAALSVAPLGLEARLAEVADARVDLAPQPLSHLGGGLVGDGDRDDVVDAGRVAIEDVEVALDEHARLAGPGPGRDGEVAVEIARRLDLGGGRLHPLTRGRPNAPRRRGRRRGQRAAGAARGRRRRRAA
jgi:hypothetical protein